MSGLGGGEVDCVGEENGKENGREDGESMGNNGVSAVTVVQEKEKQTNAQLEIMW